MMDNKIFYCQCYSPEHTITICYDDEDNQIYTTIYLNQYRNIFKRILVAIKYILGYKCKYGHWDTFILRNQDKSRLLEVINQLKD